MSEDESVPFRVNRDVAAWEAGARQDGPVVRKAVGAEVIDISAMIRELDANPDARRRQ